MDHDVADTDAGTHNKLTQHVDALRRSESRRGALPTPIDDSTRCARRQLHRWIFSRSMSAFGPSASDTIGATQRPMSAMSRGFNRSTQHRLILLDWEVSDGGECTDVVHAETAGRALGAMEERSMCGGHRPSA